MRRDISTSTIRTTLSNQWSWTCHTTVEVALFILSLWHIFTSCKTCVHVFFSFSLLSSTSNQQTNDLFLFSCLLDWFVIISERQPQYMYTWSENSTTLWLKRKWKEFPRLRTFNFYVGCVCCIFSFMLRWVIIVSQQSRLFYYSIMVGSDFRSSEKRIKKHENNKDRKEISHENLEWFSEFRNLHRSANFEDYIDETLFLTNLMRKMPRVEFLLFFSYDAFQKIASCDCCSCIWYFNSFIIL